MLNKEEEKREKKRMMMKLLIYQSTEIYDLREKYDIQFKKWTEIILWSIFYDFFNKKLKEINLNFDTNNYV